MTNPLEEFSIAKNKNTFAKRQRELEKKAKAEAKRARRQKRKQGDDAENPQLDQGAPSDKSESIDS